MQRRNRIGAGDSLQVELSAEPPCERAKWVVPLAMERGEGIDPAGAAARARWLLALDGKDDGIEPSQVAPYLNRLSELVWTLARWHKVNAGDGSLHSRDG